MSECLSITVSEYRRVLVSECLSITVSERLSVTYNIRHTDFRAPPSRSGDPPLESSGRIA